MEKSRRVEGPSDEMTRRIAETLAVVVRKGPDAVSSKLWKRNAGPDAVSSKHWKRVSLGGILLVAWALL